MLRGVRPGGVIVWGSVVIAVLFLSLPVLTLVLRGIQTQGWLGLPGAGVNQALLLSLLTTSIATCLIGVFGTPLAFLLSRTDSPYLKILNLIVELPIVLPPAVAGLALLVTFGRRGLFGGVLDALDIRLAFTTAAVIMAQIFVAAPFYIRAAQIGFSNVPAEVEDAARVDGAHEWDVFRLVTFPMARRALAAGLLLSWTRALGEFGATILFAGSLSGVTQTMPLLVYNILERDLDAAIWSGVILVIVAVIALVVARSLLRDDSPADFR